MYNIMEKIDLKDRKLLYYLDLDSRQSLSQVGKKVGLPKNVVSYRINRLEKMGVIKKYHTYINLHKLGYQIYRFYFKYQYATPEIKKEIVEYFVKNRYTGIVHTVEGGNFDLVVYVYVKNLNDFYNFWQETLIKYRDYFANQITSIFFEDLNYDYSFLTEEKKLRKKVGLFGGKETEKIDDLEYKLLKLIASDARLPTKEIAKQLNVSAVTVGNRIKKLIDIGVIQWFRVNMDLTKLGYRWHKVDIVLRDYKKLSQISKHIELNPHFVCIDKTLGYVDLEMEFFLRNINELHQIMEDLSVKFPNTIRNYSYVYVVETHKHVFFPLV